MISEEEKIEIYKLHYKKMNNREVSRKIAMEFGYEYPLELIEKLYLDGYSTRNIQTIFNGKINRATISKYITLLGIGMRSQGGANYCTIDWQNAYKIKYYEEGHYEEIAKKYEIKKQTVYEIKKGKVNWKWL